MLRWSLLSLGVVFFSLGLLTVFRSPDWSIWQLALLAGEFGHWLAIGALATGGAAWWTRHTAPGLWLVTLLLSAAAMLLLLKPTIEAKPVGDLARRDLDAWGAPPGRAAAFSLHGYFSREPAKGEVETLTYSGDLQMDFYRAVGREPAPCIIVVHGGGWDSGTRDQLSGLNHWLARQGYAVAAISYRLAPQFTWPAQRDDTLAAIHFVKANAARLGVDATRLVLLGRSAGGQIAEAVGYTVPDPAIRGVVGLYCPSDLHFAYKYGREDDVLKSPALLRRFLGGAPDAAHANYDGATALRHVTPLSPPTLLIHGELDTLVWHRHSVRLQAVLECAGVPCVLVSLPWATHAFEFNLTGPGGQLTRYALERFLAGTVGRTSSD